MFRNIVARMAVIFARCRSGVKLTLRLRVLNLTTPHWGSTLDVMRRTPNRCDSRNIILDPLLPWPRLRRLLDDQMLDALVVSTPENVTYVSEYWGLSHWARRGTQVYSVAWNGSTRSVDVIVPATLADEVTEAVAIHSHAHAYGTFPLEHDRFALTPSDERLLELATNDANPPQAFEVLHALLRDRLPSGGRVAIESGGLAEGTAAMIATAMRDMTFVPADDVLARVRAVKSGREIELLRRASTITENAVDAAVTDVAAGTSEDEVAQHFRTSLIGEGALPETTVLGSGPRSALPNAAPSARKLSNGDILRFDVGCRYHHYVSDIARTVAIGTATAEQRSLYSSLSAGLEAAADLLHPGATGSDVFGAALDAVRATGLPGYQRTHCGHGIGIANYDLPRITADSTDVLEPGMVICLETPYYRLGSFGLQVEDTFVITDKGAERMTHAPRQLKEIAR